MIFGGRVAEELVYGLENVTTGAGNDIQQATSMARKMVTEWGMSDKLGPLRYEANDEEIFLGHSVTQHKNVSEATAQMIDEEIRRLIEEAELLARKVLDEHIDKLHRLAKALLEYETLSGEEVQDVLKGQPIHRPDESSGPPEDKAPVSTVPSSGKFKDLGGTGDMEPEPQPGS